MSNDVLYQNTVDNIKKIISDDESGIKLSDYAQKLTGEALEEIIKIEEVQTQNIEERLNSYNEAIRNVQSLVTLAAYWGNGSQLSTAIKVIKHLSEPNIIKSGDSLLLDLRWFPVTKLLYSAGIGALAKKRYEFIDELLNTNVNIENDKRQKIFYHIVEKILTGYTHEGFKKISGYETHRTPVSQYLYDVLEKAVKELLFIGNDFSSYFGVFELLIGLYYFPGESEEFSEKSRYWGPIGRNIWKNGSQNLNDLNHIIIEHKVLFKINDGDKYLKAFNEMASKEMQRIW